MQDTASISETYAKKLLFLNSQTMTEQLVQGFFFSLAKRVEIIYIYLISSSELKFPSHHSSLKADVK